MKITISCLLFNMDKICEDVVADLMLQFCSAKRYSYQRIIENLNNDDFKPQHLDKIVSEKYGLNTRQSKDAIEVARQTKESQKELLNLDIDNLNSKITAIQNKIVKIDETIEEKGPKAKLLSKKRSYQKKLDKRQRKLDKLMIHKNNGTLPSVIFGGKKNFYDRCKGKITNAEYKSRRNNQFVSRGDATKGGNPNLRIVEDENGMFFLEITTRTKILKNGKDTGRYEKVRTPIYVPEKRSKKTGTVNGFHYKVALIRFLNSGKAYQVELLKRNGKVYAHVTFELEKPRLEATAHNYMIGIDTNPDGLALTMIDRKGNYVWHTYLKDTRLLHVRSNIRNNICGELAATAIRIAKHYGAGISIEDLYFKDNIDVRKKFRRASSQFCYSKLIDCIVAACYKYGVELTKVKPHYTSKIGLYKYCHQYGMDVHNGAAMVIARRGYEFKEKVPKAYKNCFEPKHVLVKKKRKNETIEVLDLEKVNCYNEFTNWAHITKRVSQLLQKSNYPRFFIENRRDIQKTIFNNFEENKIKMGILR